MRAKGAATAELVAFAERTGASASRRRPQRNRAVYRQPSANHSRGLRHARVDHVFSPKDTLGAMYTVDDGGAVTATPLDPYSTDIARLREQALSLEETHVFSPSMVNTARLGYSRAAYYFLGELTPGTPATGVTSFVGTYPTGAVVVGGSTASNPATQLGFAGSNNGTNLDVFSNLHL